MRTRFVSVLITTVIFSILHACSDESTLINNLSSHDQSAEIKTRGNNLLQESPASAFIKGRKVTKEFVPVILEGFLDKAEFKSIDKYSLTTVTNGVCELMYIVNFEQGGWAIVSGRFQDDNQILAYGTEGEFDPNNIESPEVLFWFDRAKSMIEHEMVEDESTNPVEHLRSGPYDNEPYVWVIIPLGYQYSSEVSESVTPLTRTQWGQNRPWNWLCPIDPTTGEQCLLGCAAVAVSQMLYYLHYNLGAPNGLYHTIDTSFTWVPAENQFTSQLIKSDYHDPSPRWNLMQRYVSYDLTNNAKHTGRFIIDIADRLDTKFSSEKSTASIKDSVFNNLGIQFSSYDGFSEYYTTNSLRNAMPVLVRADNSNYTRSSGNDNEGHAWVIDGFKIIRTTSDYQRYLRIIPTDSLSFYNYLDYDNILTDSQKEYYYPGIDEYEIIHDYSYSYSTKYHMNWGWNGSYYNSYYSSSPMGWNPYPYVFDLNVKMYYGFTIDN